MKSKEHVCQQIPHSFLIIISHYSCSNLQSLRNILCVQADWAFVRHLTCTFLSSFLTSCSCNPQGVYLMQYLPNYLPNHPPSTSQTCNQSLAIRSAHSNRFYLRIFHSQKKHVVGEGPTLLKLLTPNSKSGFSYIGTKHLIYGQFGQELVPLSCSRWITDTVHTLRAKHNDLVQTVYFKWNIFQFKSIAIYVWK